MTQINHSVSNRVGIYKSQYNGSSESSHSIAEISLSNQGIGAKVEWQRLRFRSISEKKIAEALDRTGVLYFPNCIARLNIPEYPNGRGNREPDFLVCDKGRWGILEVDGEPFHPASRAAQDHERDRLFRSYGILLVERFDANRCYKQPDLVVKEFLGRLNQYQLSVKVNLAWEESTFLGANFSREVNG